MGEKRGKNGGFLRKNRETESAFFLFFVDREKTAAFLIGAKSEFLFIFKGLEYNLIPFFPFFRPSKVR